MLALQDPKEVSVGERNHDAGNPDDGNVSIMESEEKQILPETTSLENEVEDKEEDDEEDFEQVASGRRKMIILSDDEDSNPPSASVPSPPMEKEKNSFGQRKIIESDSESKDDGLFNKESSIPKPKVVYNRDLFDTELSDEDQPAASDETPLSPVLPQEDEEPILQKDKKKASKPRQSSIKAQQEIKEIHSESQRLVRESRVSLPYHRPKQRTLAEFLARRKQTMPPKIQKQSLKMSMRNMEALRLLEEKKKQAEEFYKSDSDGEDPDDLDWAPEKKDEASVTVEELSPSTATEKGDQQTGTEKQLSLCTVTKERDEPVGTEEEEGSNAATQLFCDDALPDIIAPVTESSTQNMESQESCTEPLLSTKHAIISSEDEGIGTSQKSTQNDLSTSLNTVQTGDIADKQHREDSLPMIECVEDKTETVTEDVKKDDNTKGSDNGEETVTSEQVNITREWSENDAMQNTEKDELKTPKLNLLTSKLPEEMVKKIMAVTPRLSLGKEGDFIDLEESSTPSRDPGMVELINRFVRHSSIKRKPTEKQQVNLNIVSKEDNGSGGECLVSSNLQVTLEAEEEEEQPSETVPGARFTSIKAALKARIREQREKQRLKRVQEKQFMETEEVPEGYQYEDNLPDEEAELTDQSDTEYETESEPEENDIPLIDKKRKKSQYMDDEAEEENDEDLPDVNDSENEETGPADSDNENDAPEATKERKRIIKDLEDESEEEESESLTLNWEETQDIQPNLESAAISRSNTDDLFPSLTCKKGEILDKDTSTASFDSSFELYGSVIAGHQPGGGMKLSAEKEPLSLMKNKSGSFSSSTSSGATRQQELTLPADDSFDASQGLVLPFTCPDPTQPHESNKENDTMAKLQLDFSRIDGTQNKDDLIGLCSGQFTDQAEDSSQVTDLCGDNVSPTQDMSELLGLCTGRFAAPKEGQSSPLKNTRPVMLPLSQDEPDEEELLGLCTAKFTMSDSQAELQPGVKKAKLTEKEKDEREDSPKIVIYSSDEETSVDMKNKTLRRQKRKRVLEFSDDEDAREPLAFDDEENEVPRTVFTGFKDRTKGGIRADFLENEAELSGSDVNSDDEMEDDNDDMEEEEGDMEHFDSNELRNQVGKAHLRSLLDSDKREVRLLQELYLEDGELHGQGRSRQFRWKNLNNSNDEDERRRFSDEEEGSDDNVEDSEWRKQKIEREKFLQEQRAKQMTDIEAESFAVNSWPKIQNLTKESLENRKPSPLAPLNPLPNKTKPNFSLKLQQKRGSFLSRDKSTLARIAEFTKDRRDVVGGAKQGGNFVFQQLEAEVQEENQEEEVEVKLKKRHSLPMTKKAKVDISSRDSDNSSSSIIFRYL